MCGSTKRKSAKVHRYYRCSSSQHRGKKECKGISVRAHSLEEKVLVKSQEFGVEDASRDY